MSTHLEQHYSPSPGDMPVLFAEAWNARDAAGIANLFAEDAEFVNLVGLWWHDRQAIYKAHDYGLRVIFNHSAIKVGRVKTRMLSAELALVHARMTLTGQTTHADLSRTGKRQNIFSFVMQKKPDGWVCVSAHNSDIVPGKETNLMDDHGNLRPVDYRPE